MTTNYILLDLETTRNEETKSECIVEIYAIKIDNSFNLISEFYQNVNPGIPLSYVTRRVTGITDAYLKDAPRIAQILPNFYVFLGNHPIIAHKASFELKVLKETFDRHDLALKNKFIDSLN